MKRKAAFVMAMIMAVSAPAGIVGANESVSEELLSSLYVAEDEAEETSTDSAEILPVLAPLKRLTD